MKPLHRSTWRTESDCSVQVDVAEGRTTEWAPFREIVVTMDAGMSPAEARRLIADLQHAVALAEEFDAPEREDVSTEDQPKPREWRMAELSKAAKRLIRLMEFRRGAGQCYLVDRPRARTALYVPTMMPSRRPEPAGQGVFNDVTVRELTAAGLVKVAQLRTEDVPELLHKMIRVYEDHPGRYPVHSITLTSNNEAAS